MRMKLEKPQIARNAPSPRAMSEPPPPPPANKNIVPAVVDSL